MSRDPDPVDAHVGARLRYKRMLVGKSQESLGSELGLTFQQIQKYEKGQNRIGASRLYRIARIFEVPVSFFFEGLPGEGDERDGAADEAPLSFVSSPEGLDLNLAFRNISDPATRRKIVELVRTLATQHAPRENGAR